MKRANIPEQELRGLYVVKGMSSSECGKHFGCSQQTVLNRLKEHGIPAHDNGQGKTIRACVDCREPFEVFTSLHDLSRCPDCRGSNRWGLLDRNIIVSCTECGNEVSILASRKEKNKNTFCSVDCKNVWQSKNVSGPSHHQWSGGSKAKYKRDEANPVKRVRRRISNQIWWALHGRKGRRSWETMLSFTLAELMRHLELQFTKGMNWDNYGEWHIDHIIPVSSFNFSSADDLQFLACFALSNLRPLWRKDNLSKGAKILTLV